MKKSFKDQSMIMTPLEYKYEVMICFWFSIDIEYLEAAIYLYDRDPIIGEIMKNLRSPEAKKLIEQHKNNKKRRRRDQTAPSVSIDQRGYANIDRSNEVN